MFTSNVVRKGLEITVFPAGNTNLDLINTKPDKTADDLFLTPGLKKPRETALPLSVLCR